MTPSLALTQYVPSLSNTHLTDTIYTLSTLPTLPSPNIRSFLTPPPCTTITNLSARAVSAEEEMRDAQQGQGLGLAPGQGLGIAPGQGPASDVDKHLPPMTDALDTLLQGGNNNDGEDNEPALQDDDDDNKVEHHYPPNHSHHHHHHHHSHHHSHHHHHHHHPLINMIRLFVIPPPSPESLPLILNLSLLTE